MIIAIVIDIDLEIAIVIAATSHVAVSRIVKKHYATFSIGRGKKRRRYRWSFASTKIVIVIVIATVVGLSVVPEKTSNAEGI